MNEITLPSRYRIRNSSPGGLRLSTLHFGHGGSPQYWIFTGKKQLPKFGILPPNLNNNWMTVVIGRSRHVTGWTTHRLVGGRILDLVQTFCFFKTWRPVWEPAITDFPSRQIYPLHQGRRSSRPVTWLADWWWYMTGGGYCAVCYVGLISLIDSP